jgi:hypothetical protein
MKKSGLLSLIAILVAVTFSSVPVANAASTGSQLLSPESGWQRFDEFDPQVKYNGVDWAGHTGSGNPSFYKGTWHASYTSGDGISFDFTGTKFRFIGIQTGDPAYSVGTLDVRVDGVKVGSFSQYGTATIYQCLQFEKTGLANTQHTVTITNNGSRLFIDALDIDASGSLGTKVDTLVPLVQGGNSINSRIVVVNYDEARGVKQSLILPYAYNTLR